MKKKTFEVEDIRNELVRYGDRSAFDFRKAIISQDILLNKYAKSIGKVKGKFSFPNVFMGNIVQAFSDKWTPYGEIQFSKKTAKNYHLKVNFPINPYDLYGSWEEKLYEEGKKPSEMPIAKYTVEMLGERIVAELARNTIVGKFDPAQIGNENPDSLKTMNGLNAIIDEMVEDTTNPCFSIPVDAALSNNIVERVNKFERGLPENAKIPVIFISLQEFYDYIEARETPSNETVDYNKGYRRKTKYGRDLVGVPGMKPGRMVAFVEGNLFRMYDRKDNPAQIDDVQIQDYVMKVFIEFHLGYDFAINQYVYVETQDSLKKRGLNNDEQNALYYPNEIFS